MFPVILLTAVILITLSIVYHSIKNGISPAVSSPAAVRAMVDCIGSPEKVYDLGSGWGTLLFKASKQHPKGVFVGIESSTIPRLVSVLRQRLFGYSSVSFLHDDIFSADISDATVLLCYLYPGGMVRLSENLEERVKKGTLIISNCFALPGRSPIRVIELNDLYRTKVYLYKI